MRWSRLAACVAVLVAVAPAMAQEPIDRGYETARGDDLDTLGRQLPSRDIIELTVAQAALIRLRET